MSYDHPTPRTDAFMFQIDDSEIDLTQVRSHSSDLENELTTANAALAAKERQVRELVEESRRMSESIISLACGVGELTGNFKSVPEMNVAMLYRWYLDEQEATKDFRDGLSEALAFVNDVGTEDPEDVEVMADIERFSGRLTALLAQHPAPPSPGGDTREEAK